MNFTLKKWYLSIKNTSLSACEGVRECRSRMLEYIRWLLTHSMVQSPSSEANQFAASQEIPRISRNPKVHYRTHKRPPPVSILGQPNPVHIPTSHLLEIHPNIIYPSMPRSPQWSPSLRFPHQDRIHPPSPHPYAPHAQPISFFTILSPTQYWVRSTNHIAHTLTTYAKGLYFGFPLSPAILKHKCSCLFCNIF